MDSALTRQRRLYWRETGARAATSLNMMRLALVCTLMLGAAFGQEQAPSQQPAPVIRESFRFVIAPTTVTDRDGHFVTGLQPQDFRLLDNGKPQKITEDVTFHPVSLVLCIQSNAVMEKILPEIKRIGSLIDTLVLGESGEVAVLAFDHRMQTLLDFTSDTGKVGPALQKLRAGSYTGALNDAVMYSINMLRNRPANRRRTILLISETRDNGSEVHAREVLEAAQFANVVIYTVNVSRLMANLTSQPMPPRPDPIPAGARRMPDGSMSTPTTQAQMQLGNWIPAFVEIFKSVKGVFVPNPAEVYTRYSGGREYSFASQKTLERAISDIGEELHSQYMLTYSPNNQDEGGFHEITVLVNRPSLKVRTRDGYWIAGPAK